MPHSVRAHHVAAFVDQDVEGESRFLDVVTYGVAVLRQDSGDLDPLSGVRG
jgi:hypothetical protein